MTDKIQEIRITPETARKALYELDGPIASDEGMIIENALTLWEEERAQLDAAKETIADRTNDVEHLQQQLEEVTERSMKRKYEVEEMNNQNKRLHAANEDMFQNREKWRMSHEELTVENNALQQQLKQAIEALEFIATTSQQNVMVRTPYFIEMARNTLSLIRKETNPHTAPAFGSADSVGTEKV